VYPQVYANQKVVQGLTAYAARLKGELARADKQLRARKADREAIQKRRDYYAGLLASVQAVGLSLAPDNDWTSIKPKVTLLDEYRTARGDLRLEILRQLKRAAKLLTVNALHERVITAMKLTFDTKKERAQHRAVVVELLHDLRKGPPALVECAREGKYGSFDQPEQEWRLKKLR